MKTNTAYAIINLACIFELNDFVMERFGPMNKRSAGHKKLPTLNAKAVLIDMDGTLTDSIRLGNYYTLVLHQLVARKHSISESQAEKKILHIFDPNREPVTEASLITLGTNFDEYWQAVMDWQEAAGLIVYDDAKTMIRKLFAMGLRIYPATTNSAFACQTKLARAGLAEQTGSAYFTELFGGAEVCSEGKSSPEFFYSILKRIDCKPKQVVMIGDDPKADLLWARCAGIEQIVIVCREQKAEWVRKDGAIFVKSLAIVPEMFTKI